MDVLESRRARRQKAVRGLLWLLPVALGAVVYFYFHFQDIESTDDAFIEAHVVPISARVAGQVQSVSVLDNQSVKKGDLLATIDPSDYRAKRDEEKAKVAAAEAEAWRAEADVKRYQGLFERDEITRQQLDNAVALSQSGRAQVAKERATLEKAELDLSYTQVHAPESGRVTRKSVEEGAYVQVGQTLLAIVSPEVWVTANFKETELTHMRPGQKVTIRVDAYPGRVFHGHVDSIQSGTGSRFSLLPAENATGNYVKVVQRVPVKIVLDDADSSSVMLAPGMSVVPSVDVR